MKKTIFLLTLLGGILAHSSCNRCQDPRNPDCCNYDPCIDEYATSAYFELEESVGNDWFPSDTIFGDVRFHAKSGMSSYHWKIGNDPREFTDSVFVLYFGNSPGVYDVQLITTHTPNSNCFPNDDGVDTFHRLLVVPDPNVTLYTKFDGKWFGAYDDDPNDTLTISFVELSLPFQQPMRTILNFPEGCDGGRIVNQNYSVTRQYWGYSAYRRPSQFEVAHSLGCTQPLDITATIDLSNKMSIKILLWPDVANGTGMVPIERHFTAHRIQ